MVNGPVREVGFWKLSSLESTTAGLNKQHMQKQTIAYGPKGGLREGLSHRHHPECAPEPSLIGVPRLFCVQEQPGYQTVLRVAWQVQLPLGHCDGRGDED